MAAVTQIRNDTAGRAYYERKQTEGKSRKEALRALKRRISNAVYRQLLADALAFLLLGRARSSAESPSTLHVDGRAA